MLILPQDSKKLFELHKNDYTQANKGLLFDRFYSGYDASFMLDKQSDTSALSGLIGKAGDDRQLDDAAARRVQLITALNGQFGVFATDWHFVTGMGMSHPAENGFSWHPVLGTPYIPGSGVKGLLRAWVQEYAFSESPAAERAERIQAWFGGTNDTPDERPQGKAGDLIFFDALPVERPVVGVDIMTPHMGKWYEQGDAQPRLENTPGDWHSPVPVSFLVTKKARFLFSLAPRVPSASAYVSEAMEHLKQALAWLGAGGKTAAGYGHMNFEEEKSRTLLKKAREAAAEQQKQLETSRMSAEERAIVGIKERLEKGEDKGKGAGSALASDLARLCEQAVSWSAPLRAQLHETAVAACKHLGIDVKNPKWKNRLRPLREDS